MHSYIRNGRRRDPDQIKREGWREQRLLAVSAEDPRLDAFERQFVINLGTRLYGANADPGPRAIKQRTVTESDV